MKTNTVKNNLRLGLGISLLILFISSLGSFISISNLIKSAELVQHSNKVIDNLDDIISSLKDAETGQRGFLVSGEAIFLEPYNGAGDRALSLIANAKKSTEDNAFLQAQSDSLRKKTIYRLYLLEKAIKAKREQNYVTSAQLLIGKHSMDSIRVIIAGMQSNEKAILNQRTESLNKFAGYAPLLIVFAAFISVLITYYFYRKVSKDYEKRLLLQQELIHRNEEIANRIIVIQNIARQISSGDYDIRLDANAKDSLGALAGSLNTMAESLQYSFSTLADKEWLQTGIANLNNKMVGEKTLSVLTREALRSIAEHINSQVAAIYLLQDDNRLHLEGSYAAEKSQLKKTIEIGEGLVGESFQANTLMIMKDISEGGLTISYATGNIKPKNILVHPVYRNGIPIGIMEFGSVHEFSEKLVEYLQAIAENVGIAIHVAQNRRKLQDLLEETQTQSEELQAQTEELQTQHTELENMNSELEAQTQKIQASEEELRVQQEELQQANRELEERAGLLEERNQIITDRNTEIQEKAEQLELSTKYKSEFLANMSHELRTPLNSILLLSRLMADNESLDKEYVEYAGVIQSSGQGLLTLIDEILDLSKIEAGKMEVDVEDVVLADVAKDAKGLFTPLTNDKGLDFEIILGAGLSQPMRTDRTRLDQILKNLLSNAIKFTSRGKVSLNVEREGDKILFMVSDTGIGIASDKKNLIFEAFQQEDGSTRRRFGGTGLGLSISRELARLLGGIITVESTEGKGSTFTLKLPFDMENVEEEAPQTEISTEKVPEPKPFTVQTVPSEIEDDRNNIQPGDNIILIVEDDTAFAKALLEFTRKRNYKGVVAVRGDLGIEMAKKYKPLAILLDIQLPVKDGWQVMEELKSTPATRHIPVHIMSSLEVKKESLMKGAVDFINKPVALEHMQQMFSKLEDALSRFPKKVLIVEENKQHAQALSFFLSNYNINTTVTENVYQSISDLQQKEVDCVILDMGIPDKNGYETLDTIKKIEGLEHLPIIIFTGKNLSKGEESRLRKYADSIVMKTAHSYQRILDEAALFLHLVEENNLDNKKGSNEGRNLKMQHVLKGKTVLIADDDVRNIFSLTKALEQHKIKVLAATDGKEALALLADNPNVDLVLMDMMMPEMDGYESTKAIRATPKFKSLPVIAVTAKTMVGDREKCIAAGASDYISKPVDIDQLISLLRVWLYDRT